MRLCVRRGSWLGESQGSRLGTEWVLGRRSRQSPNTIVGVPDAATISVITSGILGALGLAFGAWNAQKERQSRAVDREFARESGRLERVEARRAEMYVDMLANLETELHSFERIYPVVGPLPPPPASLSDAEWIRLKARTVALGSPEVVELVQEFFRISADFVKAWQACEALDNAGARPGADFAAAFEALDAARKDLRQRVLPAIEQCVREELG